MHRRFAFAPKSALLPVAAFLAVLAGAATCGLPVLAQTPPQAPPAKPAKPMTLQQGLAQLDHIPKGVTLTVGPQWEDLPKESLPPAPSATPSEVAASFGKANPTFGSVLAIGPPMMVLLNASPGVPDPYAGMASYDVVPLFAASLTDAQWTSLTGEQGLGIAELTDVQRQLFTQMLPDGRLRVAPWFGDYNPTPAAEQDLSDQLPSTHLRLKQTAEVQISSEGEEHSSYQMQNIPPPTGNTYKLLPSGQNYGGSQETVYGQRVRAEVPNQLKAGDLDMSLPILKTPIPVGGMKTVGDLMARVSQATHLEIYADRRLEQKTLLILGTGRAAPAEDLLKATAFCLTGVYRRLGPAFVLTDDEVGIATRMARWQEFEKTAVALRQKPLQEARAALNARFGTRKIPGFGDPLALTEAQLKDNGGDTPLSKLTPAQQEAVRDAAALWEKSYDASIKAGLMKPLDLGGPIHLYPTVALQLVIPSLSSPVDMGIQVGRSSLFPPPAQTLEDRRAQSEKQIREILATHGEGFFKAIRERPGMWPQFAKEHPEAASEVLAAHPDIAALVNSASPAAPIRPGPKLADVLRLVPNRAALVSPVKAEDADADVAAAQALGMTQIWVSVFADGQASLDPLTEVLKRTQTKAAPGKPPLKVFAVLDLLSWGPKPPPAARDLTVLGETSAEAEARHQQILAPQGEDFSDAEQDTETTPGIAVSSFAPAVQNTLLTLVRSLAATPGLAGVVFRQTAPPGYDLRANEEDNRSLLLGYGGDTRLAFLRSHHADPVDVFSPGRYNGKANTDLPNFQYDGQLSQKVNDEWNSYRRESNVYFLNQLRAAARPLRVIVKQRGLPPGGRDADGKLVRPPGLYAAWDAPNAPPPTLYGYRDDRAKQPLVGQDPLAQAKAQSPLVLAELPTDGFLGRDPAELALVWRKAPPPGVVIDAGTQRFSDVAAQWTKH
jgi:hypothetical protein